MRSILELVLKAPFPRCFTLSGRTTDVSSLLENANMPMLVRVPENATSFNPLLQNARSPIF